MFGTSSRTFDNMETVHKAIRIDADVLHNSGLETDFYNFWFSANKSTQNDLLNRRKAQLPLLICRRALTLRWFKVLSSNKMWPRKTKQRLDWNNFLDLLKLSSHLLYTSLNVIYWFVQSVSVDLKTSAIIFFQNKLQSMTIQYNVKLPVLSLNKELILFFI